MNKKPTSWINNFYTLRIILWSIAAIPLCALLIALGMDIYHRYTARLELSHQTAATIRGMAAVQIERFLTQSEATLAALAQRPAIQALDSAHCDPILGEAKRLFPSYSNVFTLNLGGEVICSAVPAAKNRKVFDSRLYLDETLRTGRFTVGNLEQGLLTGKWVTTLAYPIKNQQGQVVGVIGMAMDLVRFEPLISKKDAAADTVVGMINQDGIVIARSVEAEFRVGRPVKPSTIKTILEEREGVLSALDFTGNPRIFSFMPVANTNWFVWVSMNENLVSDASLAVATRQLAYVLVLLVIVLVGIGFLIRRIILPLQQLSLSLERDSKGSTPSRPVFEGPTEIQNLSLQVNSLLDALSAAKTSEWQNEERFRTAFLGSPNPLIITNMTDGRYIEINEAFTSITGWRREEVIGRTSIDINIWQNPDDRELLLKPLREHGAFTNLKFNFLTKSGHNWSGLVSAYLTILDGESCICAVVHEAKVSNDT